MNISPITTRPGQVLGLRPARRHEKPGLYPIYAIAGGSEPAGDPPAAPPVAPPPAAPPAAPPATPPATPPAAGEFKWDGKVESLPADVQKLIKDAREDAGKARTTAKETAAQEARDALLKQLGLKPDGTEEVDPEKLAAQLASKDAQLLQLQRSTAASKAARTQGADVDALLDSVTFIKDLGDLDPAADDFDKKVDALVKTTLEKNPKLKAAQAAGRSGGQFTGGSGEGNARPTSIGAAIAARSA